MGKSGWLLIAVCSLVVIGSMVMVLRKRGSSWKPALVAGATEERISDSGKAMDSPFQIKTGPNSYQVVANGVHWRDYWVDGDFDSVYARAKKEFAGWQEMATYGGTKSTVRASEMDFVFEKDDHAVTIFRVPSLGKTKVRVWVHSPGPLDGFF